VSDYTVTMTEEPGRGAFPDVLDLHITEEPCRARDAEVDSRIRAAGWSQHHVVLEVQPLAGPSGYVRVLWRMDPGDAPPDAYTIFRADEWVAMRP
jgi:hypothetical protein